MRSQIVNFHVHRLKDIVGPLMNTMANRPDAGHTLSYICERVIRTSAQINCSNLSFQFLFNECGVKFSEQSHDAMNNSSHPRDLQNHHWRVMCVITPGITYRDDSGVSVDPRFISKANVLVMR